jgi:hypothetical protein
MKIYLVHLNSKTYGEKTRTYFRKSEAKDFIRHIASKQPGEFEARIEESEIEISQAAAAMGRKGGAAKSEAKADAARANGKRGGRPKKPVAAKPLPEDQP